MSIPELILTGLAAGIVPAIVGWLQARDMRTRLVLKSQEHDSRLDKQESRLDKAEDRLAIHGERIAALEATKA